MNTRTELTSMKVNQLKELCNNYNIPKMGKKAELIQRISDYETKKQQKQQQSDNFLVRGNSQKLNKDGTIDTEFENKTWPAFCSWWSSHNLNLYKQEDTGFNLVNVSHPEIRATFMDYDYTKSDLRKDSLVPTPTTRSEEFIEMFFAKIGQQWEYPQNEDYDEWDETTQQDFIAHMKCAA